MSQVPAREHLKTLIEFYRAAEKLHREAEADVVFAKKRRDEARSMKSAAWDRLAEARKKYEVDDLEFPVAAPLPQRESSRRLVKKTVVRKSSLRDGETSPYPPPLAAAVQAPDSEGDDDDEDSISEAEDVSPSMRYRPLHKEDELHNDFNKLKPIPDLTEQGTPQRTRKSKMTPIPDAAGGPSTPGTPQRTRQSKMTSIPDSGSGAPVTTPQQRSRKPKMAPIPDMTAADGAPITPQQRSRKSKMPQVPNSAPAGSGTQRHRKSTRKVLVAPVDRSSTAGGSFLSPSGRKSTSVRGSVSMHRRTIPLESKNMDLPILAICKGRSREWYESNFDAESLGLAKRFYQAALGTKTNAATNQVHISSVLLSDEWNTMATTTAEVQELYIGVSNTSDGKETLRDRAARALVQPPQRDAVAIFFAPKKTRKTEDVYYGGHWKVVAGSMLEPPRVIKGMPRQCLAKFVFCGVDPEIVKAVNGD